MHNVVVHSLTEVMATHVIAMGLDPKEIAARATSSKDGLLMEALFETTSDLFGDKHLLRIRWSSQSWEVQKFMVTPNQEMHMSWSLSAQKAHERFRLTAALGEFEPSPPRTMKDAFHWIRSQTPVFLIAQTFVRSASPSRSYKR